MPDPHASDYDRGVAAGTIGQRLAEHDDHFRRINGSLEKVAHELGTLTLAVQRLADQAVARDATTVKTAAALKDADEARRLAGDQRWKPWQKGLALLGGLVAVAALVVTIVALT